MDARIRGVLLQRWAAHCQERWGAEAVARIRSAADVPEQVLPDAPDPGTWYPVQAHLALTRAIVDQFLAGDVARLQSLAVADAVRNVGPVQRMALRALGPRQIGRAHV